VVDGANVVAANGILDLADVCTVDALEGSVASPGGVCGFADVRGNDPIRAIALAKGSYEFGADLAKSPSDEN
jgi:hypothetical protein